VRKARRGDPDGLLRRCASRNDSPKANGRAICSINYFPGMCPGAEAILTQRSVGQVKISGFIIQLLPDQYSVLK
jgi:hypothetical protein